MTPLTIKCKIVGVYQTQSGDSFARLEIENSKEIYFPIDRNTLVKIKWGDAKLTLEVE